MTGPLRPVFFAIGMMVAVLALAMLIPAAIDTAAGERESASAFLLSAIICFFFGGAVALATRSQATSLSPRAAFILTVGS